MVAIKDKLKIEIVENNNEVLPIIIRDIGANLKGGEDVALLRFDSYADLMTPVSVRADEIETLKHLVNSITNQSWILPAVYRGLITKIFWFKPPWAHQFQDGKYQLQVGKCQQTGLLKVTSTNPYFTSNCVYSSSDRLTNIHTVDVYVSTAGLAKNYSTIIEKVQPSIYDNESGSESLDADNRKKMKTSANDSNHKDNVPVQRIYPLDATIIDQLLETRQFMIDINLSFFSTDDYIRKQFDENEYEILRYVYTRIVQDQSDAEIQRYIIARENALEQIRSSMDEYLTDPKLDQPVVIDNPYLSALISIIRYKKLDWKAIHDYGIHLSDTRPPLHVSSEEMVIYMNEAMAKVLQSIKKSPILVTVSRCVDDGYCSLDHADMIQKYVERKLRLLYKVDQTVGKSLLTNDDDDDLDEDDLKDRKSMIISDDENSRLSTNGAISRAMNNNEKPPTNEIHIASKHISLHNDKDVTLSPPLNSNNRTLSSLSDTSPTKGNPSPGEITKTMSPSSLSEGSPILD